MHACRGHVPGTSVPRHALAGPCNSEHACGWAGVCGTYPRVPIARQGLTLPPSTCTRRAIQLPAASILTENFPPLPPRRKRTGDETG